MDTASPESPPGRPRLLIVDDSESFCSTMERVFGRRGYEVRFAHAVREAEALLGAWSPEFALLDLRLPGPAGLALIPMVKAANPDCRVVMLTGFASIATAVEAIKLGAVQYLPKPVDAETVEAAFGRSAGRLAAPQSEELLSVHRLEWEHIQRVLTENRGNISATARALRMHRRTLQRKLGKHPAPS
ncbi:MAG: response regulator [Burkholderiales bacterium]